MRLILLFLISFSLQAKVIFHHDIEIKVDPASGSYQIADRFNNREFPKEINIPSDAKKIKLRLDHTNITFKRQKQGSVLKLIPVYPKFREGQVSLSYEVKVAPVGKRIPPSISAVIDERGIYLSPSSLWYPYVANDFETINLKTVIPADWTSVTSGNLLSSKIINGERIQEWVIDKPIDRLFLAANRLTFNEEIYRGIKLQTYFHHDLASYSSSYLQKLKNLVDLYMVMLGDYPYKKFAVVSNFVSTGYGMPGFTLLDKNIIPYDFIVDTSLGHEFLHNWWGNGVYVDWSKGNWSEGLTTYQADYHYKNLISTEEGRMYRLQTLREYNNYVQKRNAFPVIDFRSRYDRVSKSIGYGKAMMIFYMLENMLGESTFNNGIREIIRIGLYEKLSWKDIERVMANISGQNLKTFFDQWLLRSDIPSLSIKWNQNQFVIKQDNALAYELLIPVRIVFEDNSKKDFNLEVTKLETKKDLNESKKVKDIIVDPEFTLMRKLNDSENPPTLNQFWSKDTFRYISNATTDLKPYLRRYPDQITSIEKLSSNFKINVHTFYMLVDSAKSLLKSEKDYFEKTETYVEIDNRRYPFSNYVIVLNLKLKDKNVVYTLAPTEQSLINVVGKLSHYGKYSALIFDLDGKRVLTKTW